MQHRGALRLLLLLPVALLAACSTVHVDAYPVRDDSAVDCRALLHDLPGQLAGRDRQLVADDVAGSWGDPAIVVRCGIRSPVPTTACVDVGDQGWRVASTADGTTWRSLGRSIQITVDVPGSTRNVLTPGTRAVLAEAAEVLLGPHSTGRPSGCPAEST